MLRLSNLTRIHGPGCEHCVDSTGPEAGSNRCPRCGSIVACARVELELGAGEVLGIVGESGSGKSTLLKCLCLDEAPTAGHAYLDAYEGGRTDLFGVNAQARRHIRDHLLGMVYQYPHLGLNLDHTSGGNIAEKLLMAGLMRVDGIRQRARELLTRTEVPLERMDEPPRRLSGGMQQRVQIAKALANNPPLLLLDEVTTGLDVSVQARVLDLIRELQRELGISMLVVSHDFGVVRMLTQRTAVMKNGRIVEVGLTDQVMEDPTHPYTQLLVASIL